MEYTLAVMSIYQWVVDWVTFEIFVEAEILLYIIYFFIMIRYEV
jgi:hypothetical protein